MKAVWRRQVQNAAPYALVLLFVVALLAPLAWGNALYWGDIQIYFHPMYGFARHELQSGRIPLWNPYVFCGQPYVGNPQMGVFYPTFLLLRFLPVWLFLSVNTGLHLFLCGAFAYRFLRRWTVGTLPAAAGALVYCGSACLVGRVQFPTMCQAALFLPLLLIAVDSLIDSPGLRSWLLSALTVGFAVLSAHPQITYLAGVCACLYGLSRLAQGAIRSGMSSRSAARVAARKQCALLISAAACGLLLASAYILPAVQLLRFSSRERMTPWQASRFVLEPPGLLNLVAPRFFGHPASADYWGAGNAWEPALFVGWLPLWITGYAMLRCCREPLVRFWSALAILGVWLALGIKGGLYWVAFYVAPGVSLFHDPARFLYLTTFAIATLTAVGLDAYRLRHPPFPRRMDAAALLALLLPLWWYGKDWNPTVPHRVVKEYTPNGAATRVYSPKRDTMWERYINYRDYGPADEHAIEAVRASLIPNVGMDVGRLEAGGYEPVPLQGSVEQDNQTRRAWRHGEPNLARLAALSAVTELALPYGAGLADPAFTPLTGSRGGFARLRNSAPIAWLVRRTRSVDGSMRTAAALCAPDFDPAQEAVVAGAPPQGLPTAWGVGDASRLPSAPVEVLNRTPTRFTFRVDAGPAPAYLVISSAAYPGWKAILDSRSATLLRTNGAFLGLAVPAGAHRITIGYAPELLRLALYLSLASVASLTGVAAYVRGRASPERPPSR